MGVTSQLNRQPSNISVSSLHSLKTIIHNVTQPADSSKTVVTNNDQFIDQVRQDVLTTIAQEPNRYDQRDIDRLTSNDLLIERFITSVRKDCPNDDKLIKSKSCQNIVTCLQWRCQSAINDLTMEDYPLEVWHSRIIEITDIGNDTVIVFIRARAYKMVKGCTEAIIQCVTAVFEHIIKCKNSDNLKLELIIDLTGVGMATIDIGLCLNLVPIIVYYYPGLITGFSLYEIPWLVRPAIKLGLALFPSNVQRLVKVVDRKTILDIYPVNLVPNVIGGEAKLYAVVNPLPKCPPTMEEFGAKNNLLPSSVAKFKANLVQSALAVGNK